MSSGRARERGRSFQKGRWDPCKASGIRMALYFSKLEEKSNIFFLKEQYL